MNLNISLDFLKLIRKNNNRDWFHSNKILYNNAKKEFEYLIETLIPIAKSVDIEIDVNTAKECTYRIFRDVRFAKDKLPYKTNFGAYISKGGKKSPYAGYYIHIEPGNSLIGGGIYMPESKNLKAIRTDIFENTEEYKDIINSASFKKIFPEIYGEKLKTAPRGFSKDFVDLELIKNKHYIVTCSVKDEFWSSKNVIKEISNIFKTQLPFNKFLNFAIQNEME